MTDNAELFKNIPKKELKIDHPKIFDFTIKGKIDAINGSGTENVKSILSSEDNPFTDPIKFNFLIKRYKMPYCLVELSGRGLLTVHGYPKYVRETILIYLKNFLKNKSSVDIDFQSSYKYTNDHFKIDFWGNKITCELAYIPSEKMFIKISSPNFLKIVNNNPSLKDYFSNGTIKFMRGEIEDLEYKKDKIYQKGLLKFDNYGVFRCDFTDIDFFNNYIEKLIDKGFFGSVEK
jgi:hypothetical protein